VTPLQMGAMGFVLILLDPIFFGYDAVPDWAGWALVLAGSWRLRPMIGSRFPTLFLAGVVAALISVATYVPAVEESLSPSAGWFVSLPQLLFMCLLCRSVADAARLAEPSEPATSRRFRRLVWALALVGVLPVLVLPAEVATLVLAAAAVAVGVFVFFVYALFRVSKRDYVLP